MCTSAIVDVVMGSSSDWDIMQYSVKILKDFGVFHTIKVISAHRMPDDMFEYTKTIKMRKLKAIIAGAGGASHLPGMLASKTIIPVFGVPIVSKYLYGKDSLYSIVQMPAGIPVATFAIGKAGAINAALHVIANLAINDINLEKQLEEFRINQTQNARNMVIPNE